MLASRLSRLVGVALALAVIVAPAASADTAPQIVLESPADSEGFYQGQRVQAGYACLPGVPESPVISCVGDVPLG